MFKFTYPQKDSFISNHPQLTLRNFGNDEIIEVEQRRNTNALTDILYQSRGLIQFDISNISSSISSGEVLSPRFFLELFTVEAVETPSEYSVIVNPVSQSWQVGTGRLYDDLTTAGVNWRYRNELNEAWEVSQSVVSGSTLNHVIDVGGTWHSQITSQSLGYATASIPITSVNEGDTFYITGSEETFSLVATHSIFTTEVGYASSSVTIPMISVFDRYCISGTDQCCVTFVGDMTLPNDCAGENYTKWIGSMLYPTESVIT